MNYRCRNINRCLPRAGMVAVFFAITAMIMLGCTKDEPAQPPASVPGDSMQAPAGWTLVWHDEFNGPSIDTTRWDFEVGGSGWGNHELEYYTPYRTNSYIDSGALIIKAVKEPFLGMQYTSARIHSRDAASWKYGRFEIRAILPYGKGIWPAIWMLPTDWVYGGWPLSGEIDIMELLGDNTAKVYGTIHYADTAGHHQFSGGNYTLQQGTFAGGYHTFALEWDSTGMRWYVDDHMYHTETKGNPFNQRFHFLLNLAVGGDWPGSPDVSTQFPQYMKIDFVRVFTKSSN